jgi:hypothetical protein
MCSLDVGDEITLGFLRMPLPALTYISGGRRDRVGHVLRGAHTKWLRSLPDARLVARSPPCLRVAAPFRTRGGWSHGHDLGVVVVASIHIRAVEDACGSCEFRCRSAQAWLRRCVRRRIDGASVEVGMDGRFLGSTWLFFGKRLWYEGSCA